MTLRYFLVFELGGAVKAAEEEDELFSHLIDNNVCKESPGFARVCYLQSP